MSKFTDRLWGELVREHGADLAQMVRPSVKQAPWMRPRLLLGSTVGVAGVATTLALALALGAASSPPAFAVSRNHDGTITVKIMRAAGIAGANVRLTQLGVRAKVVQVVAACGAPSLAPVRLSNKALAKTPALMRARALAQARISPRKIPLGRTLVIATWPTGRSVSVAPGYTVRGGGPACLPPIVLRCRNAPIPGAPTASGKSGAPTGSNQPLRGKTLAQVPVACAVPAPAPAPGNSGNSGP